MATEFISDKCSMCKNNEAKCNCTGCKQFFCIKHFLEHRQQLSIQFDNDIVTNHDRILEQINKTKNTYDNLFSFIDQWEKTTIEKIKKRAEQVRQQLTQMIIPERKNLIKQFEFLSTEVRRQREDENFDENNLKYLQEKMNEIYKIIEQLTTQEKDKIELIENDQIDWNKIIYLHKQKQIHSINNKRQQQLTSSIIQNLIISMGLPLSIVDDASFKHFMNDVDPTYKSLNTHDLIRLYLPVLQKKCVLKLQDICAQSNSISLTLNIWSTYCRLRSYFGITLHTIINNEYKSFVISFEQLQGKLSAVKVSAEFDRIIQFYNLKNKVVRLIADNTIKSLATFDDIILPGFEDYFDNMRNNQLNTKSIMNEEYYVLSDVKKHSHIETLDNTVYKAILNSIGEEEYLNLPCFAQCLQSVVNDGIKACDPALESLKKVASLAKLANSNMIFAEQLEKVHHTIPKANRTKWNNQFQIVKKIINIPSSILNSMLNDMNENDLILNSRDRKILEEFVSLFELLNEATAITQGESYINISYVAPTVLHIFFDLESKLSSSTLVLVSPCNALISSIKARFSGLLRHFEIDVPFNSSSMSEIFSDPIFLISPLFNARFKLLWLNHFRSVVKMRVIEKILSIFDSFSRKLTFPKSQNVQFDVSTTVDQDGTNTVIKNNSQSVKRKCLFPYLNESKAIRSDTTSNILNELDRFLCEKSCEEKLLFEKRHTYPCLYQLSLKYLTVPATSATIEHVFLKNMYIMHRYQTSLTEKNVCLLTFLKCNKLLL